MKANWQTKIAFWMAICASGLWLLLTIATAFAGIRDFIAHGFGPTGRGPIEILIVSAVTLQPPIILFLIVRAIRLRNDGHSLLIVVRALYPLALAVSLFAWPTALQYLDYQSEMRMIHRWTTGSITYVCSADSPADFDPKRIGPIQLRLTEFRHLGKLGTWIVAWPGKKPIDAVSFEARTGSYGGSQGIAWREPDGRHMIAYISFSDVINENGDRASIWVALMQGDAELKAVDPDTIPSTKFTCGPDPTSYRE